jgi:hypothetical protein
MFRLQPVESLPPLWQKLLPSVLRNWCRFQFQCHPPTWSKHSDSLTYCIRISKVHHRVVERFVVVVVFWFVCLDVRWQLRKTFLFVTRFPKCVPWKLSTTVVDVENDCHPYRFVYFIASTTHSYRRLAFGAPPPKTFHLPMYVGNDKWLWRNVNEKIQSRSLTTQQESLWQMLGVDVPTVCRTVTPIN